MILNLQQLTVWFDILVQLFAQVSTAHPFLIMLPQNFHRHHPIYMYIYIIISVLYNIYIYIYIYSNDPTQILVFCALPFTPYTVQQITLQVDVKWRRVFLVSSEPTVVRFLVEELQRDALPTHRWPCQTHRRMFFPTQGDGGSGMVDGFFDGWWWMDREVRVGPWKKLKYKLYDSFI